MTTSTEIQRAERRVGRILQRRTSILLEESKLAVGSARSTAESAVSAELWAQEAHDRNDYSGGADKDMILDAARKAKECADSAEDRMLDCVSIAILAENAAAPVNRDDRIQTSWRVNKDIITTAMVVCQREAKRARNSARGVAHLLEDTK